MDDDAATKKLLTITEAGIREWHGNEFGLALRHSFRTGDESHGSARFTWSFPLVGNIPPLPNKEAPR